MASQEERDRVAMDKFGKKFDELEPMQRIQVGGTIGGTAPEHHAGDPEMRNQVAQEKFGKNFDELDPMQRIQVGGTIGGRSGHAEGKEEEGQ